MMPLKEKGCLGGAGRCYWNMSMDDIFLVEDDTCEVFMFVPVSKPALEGFFCLSLTPRLGGNLLGTT